MSNTANQMRPKRPKLHALPMKKQVGPSITLMKKALRLFMGRGIDKKTRHLNAKKWLAANAVLGERHLLRGGDPRWGIPGDHADANGVYAPRRYGAKQ